MATRNTKSKKSNILGTTVAWGVAQLQSNGAYELVATAASRDEARATKRHYIGSDFKLVRINATFEAYTK